jgi:hypothetical protein
MRWSCCRRWRRRVSSSSVLHGLAAIAFATFATSLSYAIDRLVVLNATRATGTCAGFASYGPACASSGDALSEVCTSRSTFASAYRYRSSVPAASIIPAALSYMLISRYSKAKAPVPSQGDTVSGIFSDLEQGGSVLCIILKTIKI